ncbi:MAG: hypothetical protein Q8T08_06935 [Ignavibacteria bacterium]|nr:hypothetical protein [Ignavibacteria bacterium]
MANPIGEVISAIASILVLIMAFVLFDPIINGLLSGLVLSAIADSGETALSINAGSFKLTVDLILVGFKLLSYFVIFSVCFRLFLFLSFKTEETNYGGY